MVNQILITTDMIGVCEALLYGYKAGLDLETVMQLGAIISMSDGMRLGNEAGGNAAASVWYDRRAATHAGRYGGARRDNQRCGSAQDHLPDLRRPLPAASGVHGWNDRVPRMLEGGEPAGSNHPHNTSGLVGHMGLGLGRFMAASPGPREVGGVP
jgi:hypothetical protein